jgi:hypothetical protein
VSMMLLLAGLSINQILRTVCLWLIIEYEDSAKKRRRVDSNQAQIISLETHQIAATSANSFDDDSNDGKLNLT